MSFRHERRGNICLQNERRYRKIQSRAIILKVYDYSETSQIAAAYTEKLGRVQALAKGAYRLKGPFGGALEPLTLNNFNIVIKKNTSLYTLAGRKLLDPFRPLRENMNKLYPAMAGAEFILAASRENSPNPELFRMFAEFLETLSSKNGERVVLMSFLLKALESEGFSLVLDRCVECGKKHSEGGRYIVSALTGGMTCKSCASATGCSGTPLSGPGRKILLNLGRTRLAEVPRISVADNFYLEIRRTLLYYIKSVLERGLKTLEDSRGLGGI